MFKRDDASKVKINPVLVIHPSTYISATWQAQALLTHLIRSIYHSAPFQSPEGEEWIMGIDEAGRGRESPSNGYDVC
jgi:hypothetical protein